MQLRLNRTTRNGKTYEYAQLVESYRRPSDGMPLHRVIASLGALSPLEIDNLRTSLQAAREKKRVVIARKPAPGAAPQVVANLRYLDLAVLLELWRDCGLAELLDKVLPPGSAEVPSSTVVAALVLQRCLEPGPKLSATRWLPDTSLPELLALAPDSFNNTRIHRVLDELDASFPDLMSMLPRHLAGRDGAFVSLFLDTTDTWFVGAGPPLAAKGKTKEGLIQQKIGIALLCNELGYPLRWETVCGSSADCNVMGGMFRALQRLSWVGRAPVICDRAMGHTAQLVEMDRSGLRYLTALTATEMFDYAAGLPWKTVAQLQPSPSVRPTDAAEAAELTRLSTAAGAALEAAGMSRADDDLLWLDLGIVERESDPAPGPAALAPGAGQQALRLAQQAQALVNDGLSHTAAARALGLSKTALLKYRNLLTLAPEVQRELADDKLPVLPLADLLRIAKLAGAELQRAAIAALLPTLSPARPTQRERALPREPAQTQPVAHKLKVRVVAYFNPQLFAEKRLRAQQRLEEIRAFVDELNVKLQSPHAHRTPLSAAAVVDRKLRSHNLVDAFDVAVSERPFAGRTVLHVTATLNTGNWALRRRSDGFTVLVAHPGLEQSPLELCRLYREKDVVEKDFQVIKSTVELRPVRHRTDPKVRAHVSICMLALLLERRLQHCLAGHGSAQAALAELRSCHLNRIASAPDGASVYSLTQLTAEQRRILGALGMRKLAAQADLGDRLTPR